MSIRNLWRRWRQRNWVRKTVDCPGGATKVTYNGPPGEYDWETMARLLCAANGEAVPVKGKPEYYTLIGSAAEARRPRVEVVPGPEV